MLPKEYRLSKESEITQAYRTRIQAKTENLKLFLKKSNKSNFQLLVVVSKKVFKKANRRNRIKRKIYSVFEQLKSKDRLPPAVTCIIQVQSKSILYNDQQNIYNEIVPTIASLYFKKLNDSPK